MNVAFIGSAQNLPPVITFSIPSPQQVAAGSSFAFTVTTIDPEGVEMIQTMTNWPPPSSFHGEEGIGSVVSLWCSGIRSGSYDVIFTASDGVNPPVSKTMTIVVDPAPIKIVLTHTAYANGQFSFNFTRSGPLTLHDSFEIQASTNLIDWVPIGTNSCTCLFTDSSVSNSSRRFYRMLQITNELIQFP